MYQHSSVKPAATQPVEPTRQAKGGPGAPPSTPGAATQSSRRINYIRAGDGREHTTTPLVWLVAWSIACAGFLVGYASGANVAVAPNFRHTFLPQLPEWRGAPDAKAQPTVCAEQVYRLTWYLFPKYTAGFLAALPIGWLIRVTGRRAALGIGCGVYILAHLLRGCTSSLPVLLVGQAVDGVAAAILYQAPFLEATEVAPVRWRGAFGYSQQIGHSIGLLCRGLLTQGIAMQPSSPPWGWRLAVLFPIWPALVLGVLVHLLPETPSSLMQRGKLAAARAALQEIRGPLVDVEDEFQQILSAAGIQGGGRQRPLSQFRTLVQLQQLPPLLLLLGMVVLREFTGSDFLLQYSQPLRLYLGLDDVALSFMLRMVAAVCYFVGAVLGCLLFDSWGRRPTFMLSSAGSAVFYTLLAVEVTLHASMQAAGLLRGRLLDLLHTSLILAYAFYAVGWAMGFFVLMAEIFPLATRSLGMSVAQGMTFAMYGISTSVWLPLACRNRKAPIWAFACVNFMATVFVYLCLPETRQLPLEDVGLAFQQPPHWLWRHFFKSTAAQQQQSKQQRRPSRGAS